MVFYRMQTVQRMRIRLQINQCTGALPIDARESRTMARKCDVVTLRGAILVYVCPSLLSRALFCCWRLLFLSFVLCRFDLRLCTSLSFSFCSRHTFRFSFVSCRLAFAYCEFAHFCGLPLCSIFSINNWNLCVLVQIIPKTTRRQ